MPINNPVSHLRNLADVEVSGVGDGDFFYYDQASGLWKPRAFTTIEAVTLYVDAGAGDDGNPGTSGSPKATILGALDALPSTIAHPCTICVRGPQNYPENNTVLEFGKFSTLDYITIKAVNSSDEDMFDNGKATGGGDDYLDDSGKSSSIDQFKDAYIWIYYGTGKGQKRQIASNTATRRYVTANWTTNPDNTSYYAIGGGATMTGTNSHHVNNTGKLVKVYGFKHTGATISDIRGVLGGHMCAYYNYCATSVRGIIAGNGNIFYPFFNYIAATTDGMNIQGLSLATTWSNVITGATNGVLLKYASIANMSATAANKNFIKDCTVGIKIESGSGCPAAGSQVFNGCATDIDPDPSENLPRWWT